jgi:hypothetical protein
MDPRIDLEKWGAMRESTPQADGHVGVDARIGVD